MAAGDWEFVWVDPDGTRYALQCIDERKISFGLNKAGTCELKVPLRTDAGRNIATGGGWGHILAYREGTLRMVLESVSTDVGPASSEGIISVSIVGIESAYQRASAIILDYNDLFTFPAATAQIGTALSSLISGYASAWMIGAIASGTTPSVDPSNFEPGVTLLGIIQAFAFRGSGFDFRFNPAFDLGGAGGVGQFTSATIIGNAKPSAVFEFGQGTRANLTGYSWKRLGGDHLANIVFVPSGETNAYVEFAFDYASTVTYGDRAVMVTSDFTDGGLRQTLADDHVLYRKQPRRILTITPNSDMGFGNVPAPFSDYNPGDTVPVKIVDDGVTIVSGSLRVYGFTITIDTNGKENVELEVSPETTV